MPKETKKITFKQLKGKKKFTKAEEEFIHSGLFTNEQIKKFNRAKGLKVSGNKSQLWKELRKAGHTLDEVCVFLEPKCTRFPSK